MPEILSLNNIGLRKGRQQILSDISFSLQDEQILTIIGPNGAGKTSLLKIILGIDKPSSGSLIKAKGLRIGYMPQKIHLDPSLPLDVLRLLRLNKGNVSQQDCLDALSKTQVTHLAKQQVQALSGGEMQRVLLARALLNRPQLLVLDEPVQGVDFLGEAQMYDLIQQVKEQLKAAVLMVSHDLHVVMAQSHEVLCINGHICCHGHPQSISANPEYQRLFGQQLAPNLGLYVHEHDHEHDLHHQGCSHD